MTDILSTSPTKDLLAKLSGTDNDKGNPRVKQVVQRVVSDLLRPSRTST